MSDANGPTDYEKLLAEVESTLSGTPAAPATPARKGGAATPEARSGGGLRVRARTALVVGAGSAAAVFLLFALLPFLGAFSGAAGAFVGAFAAAFVLRRSR